jgi:hypothetical protein
MVVKSTTRFFDHFLRVHPLLLRKIVAAISVGAIAAPFLELRPCRRLLGFHEEQLVATTGDSGV